ncbi:substrate-binding domain-containing protein [Paenibacillus sp. N3.4]|uniref:substrate-binding domain-containing protein n=1 Tax=Paenibacillus sp. N3.4 TaxID=2603222 RepID=UPI0011C74F8A|nr:substrate-binding domain-containing protein [Paenibacillus sp. N3.4]TXK77186.1 substrate-binding domain-containing protein [Paenibacillus sp. N3.4]
MRLIKKGLGFTMILILMMGLMSACSKSNEAQTSNTVVSAKDLKDVKIGLSMQTLGAPYFVAQKNGVEKVAKGYGMTVLSVDAQGDMNKQLADVEDLLTKNIDMLILNPQDPKGAVAATKAATKKGVPVFIMDNSISSEADFVTMVQSNNLNNGELVGAWLAGQMAKKEIKLGVLSGNQGNLLGVDRRIGVIKGLVEEQLRQGNQTHFKVVTQGWGAWSQEGGLKAAEDMLVASPDMNVLVAENDSMALGALQAIQHAGKEGQILVLAAADGQKEALALIKEGKYGATGLNDPALVAKTLVDTAVKYYNGDRNIPKLINTAPAVISKSNVDKFYKLDADF